MRISRRARSLGELCFRPSWSQSEVLLCIQKSCVQPLRISRNVSRVQVYAVDRESGSTVELSSMDTISMSCINLNTSRSIQVVLSSELHAGSSPTST